MSVTITQPVQVTPVPQALGTEKRNHSAQSASIASTKLTDGLAPGTYLVVVTLAITTADALALGTVAVTVAYTDEAGATTQTIAALAVTTAARSRAIMLVSLASGDITYSTTVVGSLGTASYA